MESLKLLFSSEEVSKVQIPSFKNHLRTARNRPDVPSRFVLACAGLVLTQRALLALMMIQLSSDVELYPGPVACNISLADKGLRVCHWNVRSLNNKKYEEIRALLTTDNPQLDVLVITESWLDESRGNSEIYIPGFNIERKDRVGRSGGGVLMYISTGLTLQPTGNVRVR